MIKDQCISVTDLRTKTKTCLEGIDKEPKYIFINNKPVAVLVDIIAYEKNFLKSELVELEKNEVDEVLIEEGVRARKAGKKNLINI